jgi:hypothetical protein
MVRCESNGFSESGSMHRDIKQMRCPQTRLLQNRTIPVIQAQITAASLICSPLAILVTVVLEPQLKPRKVWQSYHTV